MKLKCSKSLISWISDPHPHRFTFFFPEISTSLHHFSGVATLYARNGFIKGKKLKKTTIVFQENVIIVPCIGQ